jgi:hypothetical protein
MVVMVATELSFALFHDLETDSILAHFLVAIEAHPSCWSPSVSHLRHLIDHGSSKHGCPEVVLDIAVFQ